MIDPSEQAAEFVLLDAIAAALREEFAAGAMIEDQPGFQDPAEAGQVNRAYRAAARIVLRSAAPADADLAALLSVTLTRLARRRLGQSGLDGRSIDLLLDAGRGRDDWLAYCLLTPGPEIERLLADEDNDGGPDENAPPTA